VKLIVVSPGPTLSVYENGKMVASLQLSPSAALQLISDLAREVKP
jgi:hypothetical protein